MRHEERGLLVLGDNRLQLDRHVLARQRVEGCERLVHENDERLSDERTGKASPLLHSAGQLAWKAALEAFQTNEGQQRARELSNLLAVSAGEAHGQQDIVDDREPREQHWLLKDIRHVLVGPADGCAIEQHLTVGGLQQPTDHVQ